MRVIAGSARGTRLTAPKSDAVRPTTDRARETLFSVLADGIAGAEVLDLFAGSGALGIEALSRGARRCVFVERAGAALRALATNLERTHLGAAAEVLRGDWRAQLVRLGQRGDSFDLVLLDPPYRGGAAAEALRELAKPGLLRPRGWIVLEHPRDETPPAPDGFECFRQLTVGETRLSLLRRVERSAVDC